MTMVLATYAEDIELIAKAGINFIFTSMNTFLPIYGLILAFFIGYRFLRGS